MSEYDEAALIESIAKCDRSTPRLLGYVLVRESDVRRLIEAAAHMFALEDALKRVTAPVVMVPSGWADVDVQPASTHAAIGTGIVFTHSWDIGGGSR